MKIYVDSIVAMWYYARMKPEFGDNLNNRLD